MPRDFPLFASRENLTPNPSTSSDLCPPSPKEKGSGLKFFWIGNEFSIY